MNDKEALKQKIIAALKTVYDPEIPVDIYELGLIYELDVDDDGIAHVVMTLTTPNCPVADSLVMDIQTKIYQVEGVTDVNLHLTFDPPWDKSRASEIAQLELDML